MSLPTSIELWCRLASREIQAAANTLRAQGLAVPTAVTAPGAHSSRFVSSLVRNDVLPPGAKERLISELQPEAIWLFGSRARGMHGPDSDWDLLDVVPDGTDVDEADERPGLDALRRERIEFFLVTRSEFEAARKSLGTLAHLAATQGHLIHRG